MNLFPSKGSILVALLALPLLTSAATAWAEDSGERWQGMTPEERNAMRSLWEGPQTERDEILNRDKDRREALRDMTPEKRREHLERAEEMPAERQSVLERYRERKADDEDLPWNRREIREDRSDRWQSMSPKKRREAATRWHERRSD
jgi:DNA replication initiation complex subunit (GINS family)